MGAFKVNDLVRTVRNMVSHECPAFAAYGAVKLFAASSEIRYRIRPGFVGIVRASVGGVNFVDFAEPGVAARQLNPADLELVSDLINPLEKQAGPRG